MPLNLEVTIKVQQTIKGIGLISLDESFPALHCWNIYFYLRHHYKPEVNM